MLDFVRIILVPCVLFGLAWAAVFNLPLWAGPPIVLAGVGFWAAVDWIRGR